MGKLEGKVAFITGAARGQGRSHAIRLAQEGADIIAIDIAAQIDTVPYPMATPEDLAETAKQVEALDRRIFIAQAGVRDEAAVKKAFDEGTSQLGPVNIVLANAGIAPMGGEEMHDAWQDVIDVNLTGVFNTVETAIPSMNALPIPWVDPVDISNAVLFLASDEARYVTGVAFPVDAGAIIK
jgi:NAD(P)-dependent dehydrogenase (short-subunit alcohol dehydrogenase family)